MAVNLPSVDTGAGVVQCCAVGHKTGLLERHSMTALSEQSGTIPEERQWTRQKGQIGGHRVVFARFNGQCVCV